jgi:Subtilase family
LGAIIALALVGPVTSAGAASAAPAQLEGARPDRPARQIQSLGAHPFAVVDLETPGSAAEVSLALAGGKPIARRFGVWRLRTPAARRVLPELRRAGLLHAVEPDLPVQLFHHTTSGDPLLPNEWWLAVIGADRVEPPGPGKPVTVIDSGLDQTHQEFAARPGIEALNPQQLAPNDGYPHGTAVSSVVGAPANALGVVGVYPDAAIRVWDADGAGSLSTSGVAAGIDAALRRGPSVMNLSLGVASSSVLEDLVNAAFGSGSIVVAAVGNDRLMGSRPSIPASLPHVLSIAGTDQTGAFARFSSRSAATDLAAPATDIPVAVPSGSDPSGYALFDGTSFSSPLVAGATAWVWTSRPTLDNTQMFELMRASARDIAPPGPDVDTGFGMLDIPAALTMPAPSPDPQEPNDDIRHVRAGGLFRQATAGVTRPGRPRATFGARLDSTEDPEDVYRVWVPGRRTVVATLRANGNAQLAGWGPKTRTVFERGAALRRDLVDASLKKGSSREVVRLQNKVRRGAYYYLDVFLARDVERVGYRLSVTTQP